MKKLLYAAMVASSMTLFAACNSEPDAAQQTATETIAPTPGTEPNSLTPGNVEQSAVAPTQPVNATPTQPAGGNVALNPEHGKPGHDCAIAVGAPLGSKPATPVAAPQAAPAVNVAPSGAPASTGSGKINPAHGQPGHDCAVAVGAPLPG